MQGVAILLTMHGEHEEQEYELTMHMCTGKVENAVVQKLKYRSPPNDMETNLLGLPLRLGGLCITNLTRISTGELSASKSMSSPLSNLIKEQRLEYPFLSASRLKLHQRRQSINNVETTPRSLHLSLEVMLQLHCREPWIWHKRNEP